VFDKKRSKCNALRSLMGQGSKYTGIENHVEVIHGDFLTFQYDALSRCSVVFSWVNTFTSVIIRNSFLLKFFYMNDNISDTQFIIFMTRNFIFPCEKTPLKEHKDNPKSRLMFENFWKKKKLLSKFNIKGGDSGARERKDIFSVLSLVLNYLANLFIYRYVLIKKQNLVNMQLR
jgi:hypothetical protein